MNNRDRLWLIAFAVIGVVVAIAVVVILSLLPSPSR